MQDTAHAVVLPIGAYLLVPMGLGLLLFISRKEYDAFSHRFGFLFQESILLNIDRIDDEMIRLIAERQLFVAQASHFKKNTDGVRDPNCVEAVIAQVRGKAEEYGADPDMVEALYRETISRFVNMELQEFEKNQQG